MTIKEKIMQMLATREKGDKLSRFLMKQKSTTGTIIMIIHTFFPMVMSKASQKT